MSSIRTAVVGGLMIGLAGCRSVTQVAKTEAPAAAVTAVEAVSPAQAPAPGIAPSSAGSAEGIGKMVTDKDSKISLPIGSEAANIDGKPDDAVWRNAVALGDFILGRSGKPEVDTRVAVTCDKDNLYLAVISAEPNTDKFVANAEGRDGKVWGDDSIEVYVDPQNKKQKDYYGFFVNTKNVVYDRRQVEQWDGEWKSATSVEPGKSWTVEMAIPFKTLGISAKSGHKLGIMVARNRRVGLEKGQGMFLVPCNREVKDTKTYPVFELK